MTICKNLTDEQVKTAFKQFDTSGDDKLDYREFCEMINKREREGNWDWEACWLSTLVWLFQGLFMFLHKAMCST